MSRLRALGVDISHWQGYPDFEKMKKAGASFVYIKASQNLWEDQSFRHNWAGAKAAGLLRGAYHFYDMRSGSDTPKRQAEYFSNLLADDPGELLPAMDFECPGVAGYPDYPAHDQSDKIVRQFSEKVNQILGVYPILYTNLAGIMHLDPLTELVRSLDLWIAWYNLKSHHPKYGVWSDWRIWQYKSTGDGIAFGVESKGLDMNAFNGTVEDLYDYANGLGLSKRRLSL